MAAPDEIAPARPLRRVELAGNRTVLVDDSGPATASGPTLLWHHGSPHTGALYEPLLSIARDRGLRMISVTRPGYGGADPLPGRRVVDAARDALEVADILGVERMLQLGASGGGPHALAVAALAADRVDGVAVVACLAPFDDSPAWWDGMADDGGPRSATRGRDARLAHAEVDEFEPTSFVDTDYAALAGEWAALGEDAGVRSPAFGPVGLADDDVAFVTPWGVELGDVAAPVVLIQGRRDRVVPPAQAELLAAGLPHAEIRWVDDAGHVAALGALPAAIDHLLSLRG
jgi:pimeloyl-ACP methyl ester carboxylesterase